MRIIIRIIICVDIRADFFEGALDLSAVHLIIGNISLSSDTVYSDIYAIESVVQVALKLR